MSSSDAAAQFASRLQALVSGSLSRTELSQITGSLSLPPGPAGLAAFLADPDLTASRRLATELPQLAAWLQPAPARLKAFAVACCLEAAEKLHHSAEFAAAEALLQQLAQLTPRLPAVWLLRARLQPDAEAGLALLNTGLQHAPDALELHSLRAQWLLQLGRGEEALETYRQLTRLAPAQPELWLGLGNLQAGLNRPADAQTAYEQGLQLAPRHAGLWNNLGRSLQRLNQPEAAEAAYRQALQLAPNLLEARNNLIALDLDRGRLESAMAALEALLPLAQNYAPAWINAGIAAGLAQQFERARAAFARARQLAPHSDEPWIEEISLLIKERQRPKALELAESARARLPASANLHWYASRLLAAVHRPEAARQAGERALERAPAGDFRRLQHALGWIERFFLAEDAEIETECRRLESELLRWQGRGFGLEEVLPELRYLPELLWNTAYLGDGPHTRLSSLMAGVFDLPAGQADGSRSGRLRLGLLVSHQHEGLFLGCNSAWPLLRRLGPDFQLVVIGDPRRLGPHLPPGVEMLPLPGHLPRAIEAIRSARLDLLYYWEIGSDSLNYFLPFYRLAPVQLTAWGTQGSPGIPELDFFLSSELNEPPGAAAHYRERLLLQPGLPIWCEPASLEPGGRDELGLPPGPLYVCLQHPLKYCPGFVRALAEILHQDPQAHLLLLGSPQRWVQTRIEQALTASNAPAERIRWLLPPLPYPRFLRYLALADVVLDTRAYSGGQTSDDTLGVGTPLVSYPGAAWRSRQTLGRLKLLGLEDGLATDWDDFVTRAIRLAHAGPWRRRYLDQLAGHRQRLVANPQGVEQFAELLRQTARETGLR